MTDVTPEILARFRWVDGHADVWRLFSDADFFPALVRALADPYRESAVSKVRRKATTRAQCGGLGVKLRTQVACALVHSEPG